MKILFVCRGNVGRSQMAEGIFNKLTNSKYEVYSAGTKVVAKDGTSRHGQIMKDLVTGGANFVIDSMNELGVDVSNNTRTQLEPSILNDFDKVVVLSEPESIPDYLKNLGDKVTFFEVDDPKDTPLEKHREVRDQIADFLKGYIANNNL